MLPEQKILIDLINGRISESALARFSPENWSTLFSEARRHRLAPLIYHKIRSAGAASWFPDDVIRKFRAAYHATASRNAVLFHQLEELLAGLNAAGIPVILLKGAHLAEFVYKNIALRPMSDLDILVKEAHLSAVVKIAFSAGFRFFYDKNRAEEKTGDPYCYEILEHYKHFQPLIHPETGCLLEIHCFIAEVGSPFDIPVSDLWEDSVSEDLNKNPVLLLSPENLIINLCLHTAYGHLYDFGLGMMYDVFEVLEHYGDGINWEKLYHRSSRWKTNHCVNLTFFLVKKWFEADIPKLTIANVSLDQMAEIAEKRIFSSEEAKPLHRHFIKWRHLKDLREKIRYIIHVVFPSRAFMANRYIQPRSSKMVMGSYIFRFYEVLKGILAIAKVIIHDSNYASRLDSGDNDFRLREWLSKS